MQNKLCLKLTRQTFWRYRKLAKENGYDDVFLNQLLDDWGKKQNRKKKPKDDDK